MADTITWVAVAVPIAWNAFNLYKSKQMDRQKEKVQATDAAALAIETAKINTAPIFQQNLMNFCQQLHTQNNQQQAMIDALTKENNQCMKDSLEMRGRIARMEGMLRSSGLDPDATPLVPIVHAIVISQEEEKISP